jgi:phosphoserine phosphatase RsbU/P
MGEDDINMASLYIYPKTGEPSTFIMTGGKTTIGRGPDNDISLSDQFCSTRHVVITASNGEYTIQDQGSKNGVLVNGRKILQETPLRRGDEILLGSTRIVFDQDLPTRVEVVEGPPGLGGYNTMIQVRDILKGPVLDRRPGTSPVPTLDPIKLEHERKVLTVLNEVSQALLYHFPLDQLLEHIMDLIIQNVPMDRGVLMLMEGTPVDLVPKVVRIVNPDLRYQNIQVSRSILRQALARNSSILLSDAQEDTFFKDQASVVRSNVRSAMCIPMWNNQEIIGIVYADRASLVSPFSEDDLKLLTLLANVAAVKIENVKLFEQALEKCRLDREMAVAAQIQRNFLPRENPSVPGFEICGRNRGCYQIGGDYYDFIPIDEARLGIAVADVSGCGVGPSLLMASLRASLHAEAGPRTGLRELAAKLNNFVHKSSESHTFITFVFATLDTRTGEMTYVNAGHNPPILLEKSGGLRRLDSTGLALGMFPDVRYESGTVRIEPGDLVCFFTDGITEGRNGANEEYGESRLIARLRNGSDLPVDTIMNGTFDDLKAFTDCVEPCDDMTLVLVRRTG